MNPATEYSGVHQVSERTRHYLQREAARDVIEASQRAVTTGTAGDFERDVMTTLAAVQAEEFGVRYRKAAKVVRARVTDEDLCETEAESEERFQRDLAARAAQHPETAQFLERFAGKTSEPCAPD